MRFLKQKKIITVTSVIVLIAVFLSIVSLNNTSKGHISDSDNQEAITFAGFQVIEYVKNSRYVFKSSDIKSVANFESKNAGVLDDRVNKTRDDSLQNIEESERSVNTDKNSTVLNLDDEEILLPKLERVTPGIIEGEKRGVPCIESENGVFCTVPKREKSPEPTKPIRDMSCPSESRKCVPCKMGEQYCRAPEGQENGYLGWSCQNNNPGNIRYSEFRSNLITSMGGEAPCGVRGTFMVFKTPEIGMNALKSYLKAINAGKHSSYGSCGNCTLIHFFSVYAPAEDQNDPTSYANTVAGNIGVNANTTTLDWVVKNKLDAFANAIKKHEGWFEQN